MGKRIVNGQVVDDDDRQGSSGSSSALTSSLSTSMGNLASNKQSQLMVAAAALFVLFIFGIRGLLVVGVLGGVYHFYGEQLLTPKKDKVRAAGKPNVLCRITDHS
jgi:hypothetical protein